MRCCLDCGFGIIFEVCFLFWGRVLNMAWRTLCHPLQYPHTIYTLSSKRHNDSQAFISDYEVVSFSTYGMVKSGRLEQFFIDKNIILLDLYN